MARLTLFGLVACALMIGLPALVGEMTQAAATNAADTARSSSLQDELTPALTVWAASGEIGLATMVVFGGTVRSSAARRRRVQDAGLETVVPELGRSRYALKRAG